MYLCLFIYLRFNSFGLSFQLILITIIILIAVINYYFTEYWYGYEYQLILDYISYYYLLLLPKQLQKELALQGLKNKNFFLNLTCYYSYYCYFTIIIVTTTVVVIVNLSFATLKKKVI